MEHARAIERSETGPTETNRDVAAAMARRSAAFDAGEDAFWNGAIGADAYMLYRLLVRLCREQSWCWPGLQWLAERTRVSIGTIKRRLEELERAGLIARRQRPGGMTARTLVLALEHERFAPAAVPVDVSTDHAPQKDATFFCANDPATDAPAEGSALIPHTMNIQTTNGGGVEETPAARLLRLGGVLSPRVRAELELRPPDEIRRCLALARQQPNIKDPAALAVALLRGNDAERGRHRRSGSAHAVSSNPAHRRPTGTQSAPSRAARADDAANTWQATVDATAPAPNDAIWQAVERSLATVLDQNAMATWFADATIAMLDAGEAVVVVGNVLARSWIRENAQAALAGAFRGVLGHNVTVAVEIG